MAVSLSLNKNLFFVGNEVTFTVTDDLVGDKRYTFYRNQI